MAMISGSLLEVACIYLSRVRSLLRTLAIAEYGYMACSIPSREPSKKGTEARGIIVSLVDVFGPIKGPNDSWVGLAPYWLTAPTYSERGEQFETYQWERGVQSAMVRPKNEAWARAGANCGQKITRHAFRVVSTKCLHQWRWKPTHLKTPHLHRGVPCQSPRQSNE